LHIEDPDGHVLRLGTEPGKEPFWKWTCRSQLSTKLTGLVIRQGHNADTEL